MVGRVQGRRVQGSPDKGLRTRVLLRILPGDEGLPRAFRSPLQSYKEKDFVVAHWVWEECCPCSALVELCVAKGNLTPRS